MKLFLVVAAAAVLTGCSQQPAPKTAAAPPPPAKINHFYAGASAVERGEPVSLCYSVENAAAVRIEPPVEGVSPSPNRCVQAKPSADAEYKLIAAGRDGKEVSQVVQVKVVARSAASRQAAGGGLIGAFAATATQVGPGQPVTICFDATQAQSVRMDPAPQAMPSGRKGCVSLRPERTTTYKLTAEGGGRTDTRQVTITVQ
ncbi:MAG TPA: hypothetical protein VN428_10520 [Bryobacteraceae bacterium]|nr:hypothetical protein [Bryobacteraceae bacterium]